MNGRQRRRRPRSAVSAAEPRPSAPADRHAACPRRRSRRTVTAQPPPGRRSARSASVRWQLARAQPAVEPDDALAAAQPPAAERPARVGRRRRCRPCGRPCRPSRRRPGSRRRRSARRTARRRRAARREHEPKSCSPIAPRAGCGPARPAACRLATAQRRRRPSRAPRACATCFVTMPCRSRKTTMLLDLGRRGLGRRRRGGRAAAASAADGQRPRVASRPSRQRRHRVELHRAAARAAVSRTRVRAARSSRFEVNSTRRWRGRAAQPDRRAVPPSMFTRSLPPLGSCGRSAPAACRVKRSRARRACACGSAARCPPQAPLALPAASSRRESGCRLRSRSSIGIDARSVGDAALGCAARSIARDAELVAGAGVAAEARVSPRCVSCSSVVQSPARSGASSRLADVDVVGGHAASPAPSSPCQLDRRCVRERRTVAGVAAGAPASSSIRGAVLSPTCTARAPARVDAHGEQRVRAHRVGARRP